MVSSPVSEVAIQHHDLNLWPGYSRTLYSVDPLLQWGDELERRLVPTKDLETYPPNAGFQNAKRVAEKRIRSAIGDRPFRLHFHRKVGP